ncbi:hypothetical protein [Pseudomonas syringae]|uniref:Uncharacterized protein n=1 Tax=Pseudomonas syringae pv. actinidiae ICMP 18807 TaxID=1194404 RepID=S6UVF3_PSESF|nr:hypothetical protein [Pseudomonas syringae]EPN45786.1 hypothetical protein A244_24964 [Pseudomonas syringae pv. actinidiae ICMP 18807]NAS95121.1 hypothetical protein [Pseudomonas syringae pv. actinidifoliorum]NAT65562.1 hypothetical protein [Pseudomonas syringae pv. actinidifoliorum]
MRAAFLLLMIACVTGCASKPDYYVSPTPVYISHTATYWVESFKIDLEGENDRFLSKVQVEDGLELELINQLKQAHRYATTKESADYLLDIAGLYKRRIGDSKGGLISLIVDDNTVMGSVDFSYKVSVKKTDKELLHFGQYRDSLQPAGARGSWENMRTMAGAITNKGNSDVEQFYLRALPRFIVDDIKAIPSR